MGIVNLTDNSFVESSRMANASVDAVLLQISKMLDNGADIIDLGACSSAPGNQMVDEECEWKRLKRVLPYIFKAFPNAAFSIDTFRSGIVRRALSYGKSFMVNDIFAGGDDSEMLPAVVAEDLEYVAMDSSADPCSFFVSFAKKAEETGLTKWILDPGFGFGKTTERNWEILRHLDMFRSFGKEILVGVSHKRMIYLPLGLTPQTCAEQSVEAERFAVSKGASIIRTHDVAALARWRRAPNQ